MAHTPTPPWNLTGKRIESQIRKALYDFSMIPPSSSIGVAVSGGKDSLLLLLMLKHILGRGFPNAPLTALHVTGTFSCGPNIVLHDLQKFCDALQVPFFSSHTEQASLDELSCYSCSRERRKKLFQMAQNQNISTIAFGHHHDDNVQTALMNLLHKGEFTGIQPYITMYKYNVTIIRPLIYISEIDIIKFARQHDLLRAICCCPIGSTSMRQTAKVLLEILERDFPNTKKNIAHAIQAQGSKKALMT